MNGDEQLEVERSYEVTEDWQVPDLRAVPGVGTVSDPSEIHLDAVYYDTPDLRLLHAGTTLRRRAGGSDEGWHLKLPTGGDRLEVRRPLGEGLDAVPQDLLDLTRARRRDEDLAPVVRLRNRRVVRRLRGSDGDLLEVTDDHVSAEILNGGPEGEMLRWREVEAELAGGSTALLDAVEEVLLASGARPSRFPSKLGRALAGRVPPPEPAPEPSEDAGHVVLAYVRRQVEELVSRDPGVRRDEPDAVHKMRVATRRLRSALATYRPVLDRSRTDPLRDELRWLAGLLGEARDAEVLRERLAARVAAEPPELVLGPVGKRLDDDLTGTHEDALADVRAALDSDRYLALLTGLDTLLDDPPWTCAAAGPATKVLPRRVRKEWRRLRRRLEAAKAGDPSWSLHDARKAAKRARYAAEVALPARPKAARRFAEAMEDVQEVLGEHQDALAAQDLLRRVGVQAHLDGENAFTFGRLHGVEQCGADGAVAALDAVWARSSRSRLRRWLR